MKLIIPMAGKGTRLRPHTNTKPKPLFSVAGKPIICHILDSVKKLNIDKTIFIVDNPIPDPDLVKILKDNYSFESVFIQQKEQKGVAHAIYGARNHAKDDDVLILFADTLAETDLSVINKTKADGIIWTKQVEDPSRFGVVFIHDGHITKLIEKPENPISDLAMIGLYYFKKDAKLFDSIEHIIEHDIKAKGEYFLTDAIQIMIDNNQKFEAHQVDIWQDSGTIPYILETNRYLLSKNKSKTVNANDSVIIKPVFIEDGVKISNSIIGPNVSVGKNTIIKNAIITDSIIHESAQIEETVLRGSIIGKHTKVKGISNKLNIGDSSEIQYY